MRVRQCLALCQQLMLSDELSLNNGFASGLPSLNVGHKGPGYAALSFAELAQRLLGSDPAAIAKSCDATNVPSTKSAPSVKPYECRPTRSSFTPNHDQAVTMLPPIASTASPRSLTMPPQRAC